VGGDVMPATVSCAVAAEGTDATNGGPSGANVSSVRAAMCWSPPGHVKTPSAASMLPTSRMHIRMTVRAVRR
jgi:hypothetical protein